LGSNVHDEIAFSRNRGFYHKTNNAGGFEGGMTNGEDIIVRCVMKPIATLGNPLLSVNLRTKKATRASVQRADVCAVEAAMVIAESQLSFVLARAFLDKFGSDSLSDIKKSFNLYKLRLCK
jgi:chorismate synthase